MEAEERIISNDVAEIVPTDQNGDASAINVHDANFANGTTVRSNEASEDEDNPTNSRKRQRSPLPEGMSRSAYKKLKRNQQWEAGKQDRKLKKKEAEKRRKDARRAAIASGEVRVL